MNSDLGFGIVPVGRGADGGSYLTELASQLLGDALAWRAGLAAAGDGPSLGVDGIHDEGDYDIAYSPREIIVLIPVLVDRVLLEGDGVGAGSEGADCWTWLHDVVSGRENGLEAEQVMDVLDRGYDRSSALLALDNLVAKIFSYWSRQPDGDRMVVAWVVERESDRRAAVRRLDGLRRRYDRDLLILADQIAKRSGES